MVTRNEVIRGELAIKNLDQGLLTLSNNKKILNYNLDVALGLPQNTEINPTESLVGKELGLGTDYYLQMAYQNNPQLKSANTNIAVAQKNIEIINTDKMPTLSGFGVIICSDLLQQEHQFWTCIRIVGRQEFR